MKSFRISSIYTNDYNLFNFKWEILQFWWKFKFFYLFIIYSVPLITMKSFHLQKKWFTHLNCLFPPRNISESIFKEFMKRYYKKVSFNYYNLILLNMERMPFKNKIKTTINDSDSKINKLSSVLKQITSIVVH